MNREWELKQLDIELEEHRKMLDGELTELEEMGCWTEIDELLERRLECSQK